MTPTPAESEILISAANIFHRLRLPGLAGIVGDVIAGREIGHFVRSGKTDHEVVDVDCERREATAAAIRKRAEEHRYARRYHREGCACVLCSYGGCKGSCVVCKTVEAKPC